MKSFFYSKKLFVLSFLLLIFTNIIILYGVVNNRIGIIESEISLTQRELKLPYKFKNENTGLSLRINWRTSNLFDRYSYGVYSYNEIKWIDIKKIKELGFNIQDDFEINDKLVYKNPRKREAFIVLEYDGESYKKSLIAAEDKIKKLKESVKLNINDRIERDKLKWALTELDNEKFNNSRLFAIDAGINPKILRDKYKNKAKFIIVKGLIKVRYIKEKKKVRVASYISGLSIKHIYIPLEHRKIFEDILNKRNLSSPVIFEPKYPVDLEYSTAYIPKKTFESKYLINLKYGAKFEPFIVSVKLLD